MKAKTILITIFIFTALHFQSHSQGYHRLINDSLYWDVAFAEMGYICDGFSDSPPWRAYFNGDSSIIDGQTYYQIGSYGFIDLDGELPTCPPFVVDTVPSPDPIAYIREDTVNQKVYKYDSLQNKEILLFDFSLNIGDTFDVEGFGDVIVGNVLYFETQDGLTRKMIVFNELLGYMLEGIGGPAGPYLGPIYASVTEGGQWLMCVEWLDGNNVFEDPCYDFLTNLDESLAYDANIEVYPNPCEDYIIIKSQRAIKKIELLNMFGEIIHSSLVSDNEYSFSTSKLPGGVYFVRIFDISNKMFQRKLIKINNL